MNTELRANLTVPGGPDWDDVHIECAGEFLCIRQVAEDGTENQIILSPTQASLLLSTIPGFKGDNDNQTYSTWTIQPYHAVGQEHRSPYFTGRF